MYNVLLLYFIRVFIIMYFIDNKLLMINSSTVERLEMSIRSRKSPPRQVKLLLQRDAEDIWSGLNQNHNRDHLATICMLQVLFI